MTESEIKAKCRIYLGDSALKEDVCVVQSDMLSFVRSALGDTVATYRWSDALLLGYITDALKEIIAYRTDCSACTASFNGTMITTTVPVRFSDAACHYAVYKAYSGEAEDESDTARRNFHLQQYNDALSSLPYRWTDSVLSMFIADGVKEITRQRPDVKFGTYASGTLQMPDYLEDALVFFVLKECCKLRADRKTDAEKLSYYTSLYENEVHGDGKR